MHDSCLARGTDAIKASSAGASLNGASLSRVRRSLRYTAARASSIAVTGAVITMNSVISSS